MIKRDGIKMDWISIVLACIRMYSTEALNIITP